MEKKSKNGILSFGILFTAFLVFIVVNMSSNTLLKSFRLDLTQDKIYSLSKGSSDIVKDLDEEIHLKYFFSKKLAKNNPYIVSYSSRVLELLKQYQVASSGKIILTQIDPEPFSLAEDEAVNYGLQGVPVDGEGSELYLGLVGTNSTTGKEVIPFLQPNREAQLEYDVSQMIFNLANPNLKTVGLLSTLPISGESPTQYSMQSANAGKPWVMFEQMSQMFEIQQLEKDIKEIPENIKTLMLVQPLLSEDTIKAVDEFVMRGGHIMAFYDPHSEVVNPTSAYMDAENDEALIHKLLGSWGVKVDNERVVASIHNGKQVRVRNQGREVSLNYPLWFDAVNENFNKDDILTSNLEKVTFASAGFIQVLPDSTSTVTPIISSDKNAMTISADKVKTYQRDPLSLNRNFTPEGQYTLAARISGPIKSAFTEKEITTSNIILVADADMLHDHFWVNVQNIFGQQFGVPSSGNGNFVLGSLENLSGSNSLISIRNRGTFARPFTKIRDLEVASSAKYQEKENALLQRLEDTKRKLTEIESSKDSNNSALLNIAKKQEEDKFRSNLVTVRKELREVRRNLRSEIEMLETKIRMFAILGIPTLILMICFTSFIVPSIRRN